MTSAGRNDGLEGEDDNNYFMVRCFWLKIQFLIRSRCLLARGKIFREEKEEG